MGWKIVVHLNVGSQIAETRSWLFAKDLWNLLSTNVVKYTGAIMIDL